LVRGGARWRDLSCDAVQLIFAQLLAGICNHPNNWRVAYRLRVLNRDFARFMWPLLLVSVPPSNTLRHTGCFVEGAIRMMCLCMSQNVGTTAPIAYLYGAAYNGCTSNWTIGQAERYYSQLGPMLGALIAEGALCLDTDAQRELLIRRIGTIFNYVNRFYINMPNRHKKRGERLDPPLPTVRSICVARLARADEPRALPADAILVLPERPKHRDAPPIVA
jgi:hypothetical protein